MLWQGNRRFVSVYRRNHQQKKVQQHSISWMVPIPGVLPFGAALSSNTPVGPSQDLDDWQVGFGRSGEPLKGSNWRTNKHKRCFDMVEHADHVRSVGSGQPSPIGNNQMSRIFQNENSVPRPVEQQQTAKPAKKASGAGSAKNVATTNQHSKNAKSKASSSVSKNSLRRDNNHKSGGSTGSSSGKLVRARPETSLEDEISGPPTASDSWKSGLSKRIKVNQKNRQDRPRPGKSGQPKGRPTHPPPETEMPIELKKLVDEVKYNDDSDASTNVDFDSYLAETEELIAHPEEVVSSEDVTAAAALTAASPAQRSAFIPLDSGGWEEVIVDQPVAPAAVAPILHQEDDD